MAKMNLGPGSVKARPNRFEVSFTDEEWARLLRTANQENFTRSKLIRVALELYYEEIALDSQIQTTL